MIEEIKIKAVGNAEIGDIELFKALEQSIKQYKKTIKRVLLLPPDLTRGHSGAGKITAKYYELLKDTCEIDIMPALGTHNAMNEEECKDMFGEGIPFERFIAHNWRNGVVNIGEVPKEVVKSISDGLIDRPIPIEVNRRLVDDTYDLIISIGQVVPHEVVGMANYSKNVFVGCGGRNIINESHFLGVVYGIEKILGRDYSPVRKLFDYAEENLIAELPLLYVLTVTAQEEGHTLINGLFIGRKRSIFDEAVKLSQKKNIIFLDKPIKKAVVFLDEKEFKSTWLGNKAIYRTRMAIADGGELLIIAPGVRKFGEDAENDAVIRKYGYVGRDKVLEFCSKYDDLKNNLSSAAHLIHGSSEGRFSITYAAGKLNKEEIENVNYKYMPIQEAYKKYDPSKLKDGINIMEDGEEIFYISNPAVGLWANKDSFFNK